MGPCGRCYTTDDYLNAIKREIQKRVTTYPKIIKKKEKAGMPKNELLELIRVHEIQVSRLIVIESILRDNIDYLDPNSAMIYLNELIRELKMRKRYYPRLIYFKRITQETADYETAIWRALTEFFKSKYLTENV